ncbi:hypothetical protein ODIN_89 [Mycobacterium phage Odin]|nr:hypothetical protein ODIN_89 [Mycobacterium phage Odin]
MSTIIKLEGYWEATALRPGDWIIYDSTPHRVSSVEYMPVSQEVALVVDGWNEGEHFVRVDRVSAHQGFARLKIEER